MKKLDHAPLAKGANRRLSKLESLLRSELNRALARELELPRNVLLSLTSLKVQADQSEVHVGVSVLPFARRHESFGALRAAQPAVQRVLNERLKLYRVPKLVFYLDEQPERADRLEHLLDTLR